MKRKIILKQLTVFILSAVFFTSCLDDPEPLALEALADVFIQKTVQDGEEKYALAFWVLGNQELKSVTVEGPEEQMWELDQHNDNNRVFSLFPEADEYSEQMPESGDYKFTIESTQANATSIVVTDKLEEKELDAIVIESIQFVSSKLKTTWQSVGDAGAYYIRLYDESEKLIYVSPKLAKSKTDHSFGVTDQGWTAQGTKAENGKTYRIEVLAILFESTSTANNEDYNVQFISIASTEIVWGE
jgi:hypothetical protein